MKLKLQLQATPSTRLVFTKPDEGVGGNNLWNELQIIEIYNLIHLLGIHDPQVSNILPLILSSRHANYSGQRFCMLSEIKWEICFKILDQGARVKHAGESRKQRENIMCTLKYSIADKGGKILSRPFGCWTNFKITKTITQPWSINQMPNEDSECIS